MTIKEAPEALEDDDILEMVNAGLMEITVVDDFVAEFWQQVFPNVRLHTDLAARTGGEIAVGVRKNSPRLLRAVNTWIKNTVRGRRLATPWNAGIWKAQIHQERGRRGGATKTAGSREAVPDLRQ